VLAEINSLRAARGQAAHGSQRFRAYTTGLAPTHRSKCSEPPPKPALLMRPSTRRRPPAS
jgi:hypothetical protein